MQSVMLSVTNGPGTIVDEDVAEPIKAKSLFLTTRRKYVALRIEGRLTYLHRYIMQEPKGLDVDHINGNRLDNRRTNLRAVTRSENMINALCPRRSKSGFRWVYKDKRIPSRWYFRWPTKSGQRTQYVTSRFVAALLADKAICATAIYHGRLNFPERIRRDDLDSFIAMTGGRFFKVVFSRRSDGRQRIMVCRIDGPSKKWSEDETYDPNEHHLIRVYDVKNKGFRLIPLEGVLCLSFKGKNYAVTP